MGHNPESEEGQKVLIDNARYRGLDREKKNNLKKFKSQFFFRQDVKWPLSRGRRREYTTVLGSQVSPSASTGHNTVRLPKTGWKMFGASHCTQRWHPRRRVTHSCSHKHKKKKTH